MIMLRYMLLLSFFAFLPSQVAAKSAPVFFGWGGETVSKVADFPDTPAFQIDGDYTDAGVIYKQIHVFFLPLWNYDIRWAGYIDASTYIPFTHAELQALANRAGVELPAKPSPPFWESYGGKLVLLIVLGFVLMFAVAKGDADAADDQGKG